MKIKQERIQIFKYNQKIKLKNSNLKMMKSRPSALQQMRSNATLCLFNHKKKYSLVRVKICNRFTL